MHPADEDDPRLRAVAFAKQFPNPAEPLRGLFVAEQVQATRRAVEWSVIAPVPWVPRVLAGPLRKPYVRGGEVLDGVPVARPRYPVLPGRRLYTTVAPAVALAARPAFRRVLAEERPAFVHAHALYPSAAAALRLCRPAGVPLVVTIHGSDLYTNVVRDSWRRELERVASEAAAVVAVGSRLARDAVSLIGADPARTLVIPDTYDDETFQFADRRPPDGTLRLATVGRLVPEKGHAVLLSAMAAVAAEGRDVSLTVVGDGPLRGELVARADALGLAGRVRFAGALPPEDLLATLAASDAFVLPSLREGFGVSLLEAMATGLPAVSTRSGGPEDIVGPGQGLLVEPGDDEALAGAIGKLVEGMASFDSRAIAEDMRARFSRRAVGDRLVTLYREVAAGRPPSGTFADGDEGVA